MSRHSKSIKINIMNLIKQNYFCIYYVTGIHVFTNINTTTTRRGIWIMGTCVRANN